MIRPREPVGRDAVAAHYDDLDAFYRDVWGEHVHHGLWDTGREPPQEAVEQLVRHVAARVGVGRGDRVCDVGCGYGGTAFLLARELGALPTGLTVSRAQHARAVERAGGAEHPCFLLRDWQANGLADASFDAVVSLECLAHVEDKALFFREVHRVLRPGGRAGVTAWLAADAPRRWEVHWLLEPICSEGRLPGLGTAAEYRDLAQAAGLRVERSEDLTRRVRRTWTICARRLAARLVTRPEYRSFLLRGGRERIFALTLLRLIAAFRTGAMRYGLLVLERAPDATPADPGGRSLPRLPS